MWKECISKYSPNIICLTLRRFICSLARLGDLKSAYEALQKMMVLAIRGSTSIRAREPENVRIRTLNVYKRELVMKLLTASFNDIIAACAYFKNYWPIEVLIAQVWGFVVSSFVIQIESARMKFYFFLPKVIFMIHILTII